MPPDPVTLVTIPPFEKNLSQYVNTDKSFRLTAYGLDKVTPVDLTAWVAVSFIIHAYGDPNVVYITKTVGSGVTFTNRPAGVMTVSLDAADVASVPPGGYQWRLERTDSGSDYVVGLGSFSLLAK